MFNCIIIFKKKILKRVGKQTNKNHCICSKSEFHISCSFPQILSYSHLSKNVVYFTVSSCEEEKEHFQSYSLVLSIRRKYLLNTCYLLFSPEKKKSVTLCNLYCTKFFINVFSENRKYVSTL